MSLDPQPETVLSFGEPSRRSVLRDLGTDRRVPLLVTALGAAAVFGSLASEWQTTTMTESSIESRELGADRMMTAGLIDLGAIGAGYLGGILLLTVAVVLTLFGPGAGRAYARLAGLGLGGVLLTLLTALMPDLKRNSVLVPEYFWLELGAVRVEHGRGLWCALAGVTAVVIALWLSGRPAAAPDPPRRPAEPATPPQDGLDLTISPTTPFASFPGELDQPHRS